MAGHRRRPDGTRPKRSVRRALNWRERIRTAPDSEALYDLASGWLRAEISHISDPARRTQALNDAAAWLAARADGLAREHAR